MLKSKKKKYGSFFGARLTSTISTSLVLFLLGIIALMTVMATQLSLYVRENMGFSVVLDENVTEAQVKGLEKQLTAAPYARMVHYISKADALQELCAELGENPEELLGYNPLRPSFEVKLHSDYADAVQLARIDSTLRRNYPYIKSVSYQKEFIGLVNDNLRLIGIILLGIAVVMAVISVVLIANTVSLAAYSKRFLLHTMVLVGATPSFIRRPFVRAHMVNGFFGALIANGILWGGVYYLCKELSGFSSLLDKRMMLFIAVGLLVAGVLLSWLAARIAVGRYLRTGRDKLYYI
ncbi:MAG: permease-like cell division protein FtsX [Porphyromonadaceae bacterium]|nr:permease-like cell division protein FtsX [Porphyromonadaceae bacterium]